MTKYLIIALIVIVIVLVIVLLCLPKKKEEVVEIQNNEDQKLNQADVNMMQNLNAGGFTAKKPMASDITMPQFKPGEKIGYKDTSHVLNNTGDHIANNANNQQ